VLKPTCFMAPQNLLINTYVQVKLLVQSTLVFVEKVLAFCMTGHFTTRSLLVLTRLLIMVFVRLGVQN